MVFNKKIIWMQIIYQIIIVICFFFVQFAFAQKTDIVFMPNGDKITGEIKRLDLGVLVLSTDDAGTINIKWDKIKFITTDKIFEVELQDGRIYYGSIGAADSNEQLIIKGITLEHKLFKRYIVKLTRIKKTFWEILDGYMKLGISFTKASEVGEFIFGANGKYRTKNYNTELNLNSVITTTTDRPASRKQDVSLTLQGLMEHRWFWAAIMSAEENTELGIQLRTSIGAGVGNYLIQSNRSLLYALGGVLVNREWFVDSTAAKFNLEALFSTSYQVFIYDHPKLNLETSLNILPSIINLGRVRMDFNAELNWEILIDFYWVLSFYINFDNKPQSKSASQTDYRIDTSFKYEL